jgi:phosphoribosylamine--glycine ligase
MKVLVVGNGGREHAIIWKLKQSPNVNKIYCTIGNAGINQIAGAVNIKADDVNSLVEFVKEKKIDFTVIGPEVPLSLGIVDEFERNSLRVFGPTRYAAQLETSKVFAKEFMKRHNIPTAKYERFNIEQKNLVSKYLAYQAYPLVIKADGLAAGKGVIICEDRESAMQTVEDFFEEKIFGKSGENVVIEEFMTGEEASVFAVCDGENYVVLSPAQDHKKILDGEKGKNTGGMGSFAPAGKLVTEAVMKKVKERIIEPVIENMKSVGHPFKGCLYCGLMIDENNDPYVIEFNARFGDPESQVVLPKMKSDFLELLLSASEGRLKNYMLETDNKFYCSVVLGSKGYPDRYETGKEITGLDRTGNDCIVFHAGTKLGNDGKVLSAGGRVLNVVGVSDKDLRAAIDAAYKNTQFINFENKYCRTDIGRKGL